MTLGEPHRNFRKKFRRETLKNEVFRKSILTPPLPRPPPLGVRPCPPMQLMAMKRKMRLSKGPPNRVSEPLHRLRVTWLLCQQTFKNDLLRFPSSFPPHRPLRAESAILLQGITINEVSGAGWPSPIPSRDLM